MSILPKETIREIIKSQNFKSANDIHSFLKDIMKDFIQESLEIELDSQLGYEKNDKNFISDNSRKGYSKKKVKSSLGENLISHVIEMLSLNLTLYLSIRVIFLT